MAPFAILVRAVFASATLFVTAHAAFAQSNTAGVCPRTDVIDAAPLHVRSGEAQALASFLEAPDCHHWVTFYFAAEKLFEAGRRDEAVRWFYVGQIRGRTVAALDQGASGMMVDALQHIVGQPINEYAGGDRDRWLEAVDWAAAWDREHPLRREQVRGLGGALDFSGQQPLPFQAISPPLTQARFEQVYAEQRNGMAELRRALAGISPEELRRMRQQNGLDH